MNAKGFSLPILLFLIITVAVLFIFIERNFFPSQSYLNTFTQSAPTQKLNPKEYAKISGRLELLPDNLKLIILTKDTLPEDKDAEQQQIDATKYYKAGVYTDGAYKGFTRVIALRPYNNMIGFVNYILATKDFKTFILDGDPLKADMSRKQEELGYEDLRYDLDISKVTKVDNLPSSGPEEIELDSKFGLHKDRWDSILIEQPRYDDFGTLKLITNMEGFKELASPIKDFRFFAKKDSRPPKELERYVDGETTGIYVVDASGLVYKYSATTTKNNSEFASKDQEYQQSLAEYERKYREQYEKAEKHRAETGLELPFDERIVHPETLMTPSFAFDRHELKDVILSSDKYFQKYENAFPHPCGQDVNTYVTQNIQDNELTKVATVDGIDIYLLTNAVHPLQKTAYQLKKKVNDEIGAEVPADDPYFKRMPDFEQYVAQKPLFFLKDYWGRIAALQENNYTVVDGCGKPVVYLYPESITDVRVNFSAPMRLDTQIPNYANGWKVKAHPDGTLIDIQPEKTNCDLLKNTFGSEYAKSACEKNEYPYLYWAGQSFAANYPKIDFGWIVRSGEVEGFLKSKLTEIGLSNKEQNDMLEYWLPQIKKHRAPYYRISLLQNTELNQLFPMEVTPTPDTVIRVFLDFMPINSDTEVTVSEQKVVHYDRNGFTLVEWGGLKP